MITYKCPYGDPLVGKNEYLLDAEMKKVIAMRRIADYQQHGQQKVKFYFLLVMIARCMEKMIDDLLVHCKYVQGGTFLRYYLDSLRTKRVAHFVLY